MKNHEFHGPALPWKTETLCLYAYDLSKPAKNIKAELPIGIDLLNRPIKLENTALAMIHDHLKSNQDIFAACYRKKPVSYLFTATSRCWIGEVHDCLSIAPQEVYLFNAYTYKGFRGKHIYPALISHVLRHYQQRSFKKALIFTTGENTISMTGITRVGFKHYGNVQFRYFLGKRSWKFTRSDHGCRSHFVHDI
jgi:GNAT superfamily N-acetyltransferase